ncbi:MAG: ATP-binding protein [Anaerorhabdus sp.]
MKQAQFRMPESEQQNNKELIRKLKSNELVGELVKKSNAAVDLVELYPQKIHQWLVDKEKCQGCKGLVFCKQTKQGEYMDLQYDGLWVSTIRLCDYKIMEEQQQTHLKYYLVDDLPIGFKTIRLAESKQQDSMDIEFNKNLTKVMTWLKGNRQKGLYLYGPVGTGKSYLAACISNRFAQEGKSVAFVNIPEWVSRMKSYFGHPEEMEKEIARIKRAEFVVFDDLGAESVTSWIRDELFFPVFNHRMENKKLTWFTSNENFESLEDHFQLTKNGKEEKVKAIRIMERIKTLADSQAILGKNRRNQ